MTTGPTLYAMASIPAPASGNEFALDADVWFAALLQDPHKFFGKMPIFEGLRQTGMDICASLYGRGIAKIYGYGYQIDPRCPHCHMRTVRARKREWAMRIFFHFLRAWDDPTRHQQLKNQVAEFFVELYPDITLKKLPLVFNAHTKTRQIRKLLIYEEK